MNAKSKGSEDRCFADITVGESFSKEMTLTGDIIDAFAKFSQDYNPLHTDPAYAKQNGFKDRVAHGVISACFFSEMVGMHIPGKKSLLLNINFNFKEPIYPGDHLLFETKVVDKNFGDIISLEAYVKREDKICVNGVMKVKMLK